MTLSDPTRQRLDRGVSALSDASDQQGDQLAKLCSMLLKWSGAYNLTAIRDPDAIVDLHILDSLTIEPLLVGDRVLDVGTGAGFPGLPLAIVQPGRSFTLLDANAKKLRFVQQVVAELGLKNVEICHDRVPDYASAAGFGTVTARAFAGLAVILNDCAHLLDDGGCIVAMKSREAGREVAEIASTWQTEMVALQIPGQSLERHAVVARLR